ncbi:MAG TPA: sulfurtransferase [Anaerolineales bacterium]
MSYQTLVSAEVLMSHLGDPNWVIVDCRFTLTDTERGRQDYRQAHIPGAVYAHLDEDLSTPHIPGSTGRHPLPSIDSLVATFSNWGISQGVQVVAYDDDPSASGAIAARLWWCLRWLGHDTVAVLDGGWLRWLKLGHPTQGGEERRKSRRFIPSPRPELIASAQEVDQIRSDPAYRLVDSRSADRYRGENETIDPVAGHIPGARSVPFVENVGKDGLFRPKDELKARFNSLLGEVPGQNVIFYCGSGVTAAHNLVAFQHAGLGEARLYAGSWSEWIVDPSRQVARG